MPMQTTINSQRARCFCWNRLSIWEDKGFSIIEAQDRLL